MSTLKYTLLLCFFSLCLNAQEDFLKEANNLFKKGEYTEALYFYKYADIAEDKEALYNRGYCYFKLNDLRNAERDFTTSNGLGYQNLELFYLMGRIRHSQNEFTKAAYFYKDYLRASHTNDPKREEIKLLLKNCIAGQDDKFLEPLGQVENLGDQFNSPYDELNPLRSPNYKDVFYFSSNRQTRISDEETETIAYDFNMYRIQSNSLGFQTPEYANESLNTFQNEIIMDLADAGRVLFFTKGTDNYEVFTDTFSIASQKTSVDAKLRSPLNYHQVKSLDVFQDSIFIFSADAPGGYGGLDLYALIRINGIWLSAINLGPEINGPYDETSPFLTLDGEHLFFSSNQPKSIGGYDVFYSKYDAKGFKWSKPQNLRSPINSEGDDIGFRVARDGKTGQFSSNRLKDNLGGYDIYYAFLKERLGSVVESRSMPAFIRKYVNDIEEQSYASFEELDAQPQSESEMFADTFQYDQEREIGLTNQTFLYSDSGNLFSEENKSTLKKVANTLNTYPDLKVELVGHTIKEGLTEFDLYFSIKAAEKIQEQLQNLGIDKKRILLKGLGSAYPLVKYQSGGQNIALSERMNRRVDLMYISQSNLSYKVNDIAYNVPDYLLDNKYKLYNTQLEGLSYKVQIAESNKLLKNDALNVYDHLLIEREGNSSKYKYTLGLYETYTETFFIKKALEKYNIKDPKIIPYLNGHRIDVSLLDILAEQYNDLKFYIEYELE